MFLPASIWLSEDAVPSPLSQPRVSLYVSHKEDTLGVSGLELARPRCLLLIKYRGLAVLPRALGLGVSHLRCWRGAGLGTPRGAVAHLGEALPPEASRRHSRKPRSWHPSLQGTAGPVQRATTSPFLSRSSPRRARAASDGGVRCRTFLVDGHQPQSCLPGIGEGQSRWGWGGGGGGGTREAHYSISCSTLALGGLLKEGLSPRREGAGNRGAK